MKCKQTRFHVLTKALILAIACTASSGCMLNRNNVSEEFSADAGANPNASEYLVRMESSFGGEPKIYRGTLTDSMTVQQALVQANAIKKYRNMEITLIRQAPGSARPLRMICDYDPAKKIVKFEQDYAIHPGDRISVKPKDATMIGQLWSKATNR